MILSKKINRNKFVNLINKQGIETRPTSVEISLSNQQ